MTFVPIKVGLRLRLLLLALFTALPALGVIGYSAFVQRRHAEAIAEKNTMNLVHLSAREHSQLIVATRHLLISLSKLPEIKNPDRVAACNYALAEAQRSYPYYTNIGLADLNGNVFCNSKNISDRKINIVDRDYFRDTVKFRDFSVGHYQIGRVTGEPAINFGFPVSDNQGHFHGVLYAALNLSWLNQLISDNELPPGSVLMVMDNEGKLLARMPKESQRLGKAIPLIARIVKQKTGIVEATGLDGTKRLYAFAPLHDSIQGSVYISIGIPKEFIFKEADTHFVRQLVVLFFACALVIIVAWVGSHVLILRHIKALIGAAQKLGEGDLSVRAKGLFYNTEEWDQLAHAFDNMSERLQLTNRTLEHVAYFDSLTGLPNHAWLQKKLQEYLSDQSHSVALMIIHFNRLWEINHAFGFQSGDQLLRVIAKRICSLMAEDMNAVRMRGSEFAVIIPCCTAPLAVKIGQQIINELQQSFTIDDIKVDTSVVIGIALTEPNKAIEASHFIRQADAAMHQAKKSSDGYAFYATEQDQINTKRLAMIGDLRTAIEGNELVLFYQPKISVRDRRLCGAEALIRWMRPGHGMIPPDEFISLAEQTGLIKPLTEWVINEAVRQSDEWRKAGIVIPIAINLSPHNLHDIHLVDSIKRVLAHYSAQADWIELEITEGAVMQDPEGALISLKQLKEMGITLSIDDFGTGYSSLGYLKKLPVDAIKIDKSFVMDMLEDVDSMVIVRSTIGLAHDLSLKVVAEGVENQETLNQLAVFNCDVAQGYYISKPQNAEKFIEIITELQRNWTEPEEEAGS